MRTRVDITRKVVEPVSDILLQYKVSVLVPAVVILYLVERKRRSERPHGATWSLNDYIHRGTLILVAVAALVDQISLLIGIKLFW